MHCSHCASLMAETETRQDGRTEQSRFECPVCGREQLLTRRISLSGSHQEAMTAGDLRDPPHWQEFY